MLRDQTWVLTGAAGRIGTGQRPHLAGQVRRLRLVDVVTVAPEYDGEEAIVADLRDLDATQAAIAWADGALHLGGLADEANFHDRHDTTNYARPTLPAIGPR
jgi:uronate dehydrogenase